jgi:hypothetical protein
MFRIDYSKTEKYGMPLQTGAQICKRLRSPEIDSKESIPPAYVAWQADTTTLFDVPARQSASACGMDSLESIPGLLKRLQIRAQKTNRLGILVPPIQF